jgi:hypothetical protein
VAKVLSCWVGRHSWTTRVEQGESYKVCSKCGKTPHDVKKEMTFSERDYRGHDLGSGDG